MKREYLFLKDAAEKTGRTVNDLIHFGATGQLDIYMLLTVCYPYLIFECGEHGNGFRTIDPNGTENAMYQLPLVGPQRITQHGLQEFEISPTGARAVFDWNKAAKIEDNNLTRWYSPDPICNLDESQMVIMAPDFAELCNKLNPNEISNAARNAPVATDEINITSPVKDIPTQKTGLDKHRIAYGFDGIHWTAEQWLANLSDCPEWLEDAQVTKGRKGKGGAALWNPAIIAVALQDKQKISVTYLNNAFKQKETLRPWADEWHETQNPFKNASK